jgi:hypothetical protein
MIARVLHIHNGDAVLLMAKRVNLEGEQIAFREVLVTGPIPQQDWIETRARFLADEYGDKLLRVRNELLEQERQLDAAGSQDEVVLWFEHDLFCLVNFLYLLKRLAGHPRVTAVWCEQPIGTREDDDLLPLFDSRRAVTPAMLAAAETAWAGYASPDPHALNALIGTESDFPFLRAGLALHAARFPAVTNGLGAVEARVMEIVAGGVSEFSKIFEAFNTDEPRYGFGDTQLYRVLWHLANVAAPMLTMKKLDGDTPPKALFAITPAGEKVLAGEADFLDLNGADFWLGGAHLTNGTTWRWDARKRAIV